MTNEEIAKQKLENVLTPIELKRFVANINSSVSRKWIHEILPYNVLQLAFHWESSPEGRAYWDEIHLTLVT